MSNYSDTPPAFTLTSAATTATVIEAVTPLPTLTVTEPTRVPLPLPTVAPSEEWLRTLPPPLHVLLPVWCGALNDVQELAVGDFIHRLPVSPQLSLPGWLFLRRFVIPYCAEQAVAVTPEQIKAEWDRQMTRHQHTINPANVLGCLRIIFGNGNLVVIGQWQVGFDPATHRLTIRRHPGNYDRLVEFLKTPEFEQLA